MTVTEARPETALDAVDWQLLDELQHDARLSYNELARRVHLSAPTVAERVRRLERRGVITGYGARVNPAAAGHPVAAFVQLRCSLGACLLNTTRAEDFPEIVAVHKLSGAHCSMLRVRATSLAQLEGVLEEIGKHGAMDSHIVLSTQYDDDTVRRPRQAERQVTQARGWPAPGTQDRPEHS